MCVFCKIVSGEFSSNKVYEDNDTIAILDLSQATFGHTLVIPKKHFADISEIDTDTLTKVIKTAKIVSDHYYKSLPGIKGINLLNNNGLKAGQTVMHYHMHIIPRYDDDNLVDMKFTDNSKNINTQELLSIAKVK